MSHHFLCPLDAVAAFLGNAIIVLAFGNFDFVFLAFSEIHHACSLQADDSLSVVQKMLYGYFRLLTLVEQTSVFTKVLYSLCLGLHLCVSLSESLSDDAS